MNASGKKFVFWIASFLFAAVVALILSPNQLYAQTGDSSEKEVAAIGIVNGTRVNIRQGPGTDQSVVGQVMRKGTVAIVQDKQGDWVKVYVNGVQGWIYSKLVDIKETGTAPTSEKAEKRTAVVKDTAKPTAQPSTASESTDTREAEAAEPVQKRVASATPTTPSQSPPEAVETPEVPAAYATGYQRTLQKAVELVFIFLNSIEQRQDIGLEEKQRMAVEFIRNIRWGPANRNYFWINDTQGKMILEPFFPKTEGENHLSVRDKNNKEIILEFIQTGIEFGEGFVDHHGLGYDDNKSNPRISIVKLFDKWNWIVGTGIELDLVETYEEPEGLNFNIPLPGISDEDPASAI
jgi:uncharacterized protein YraI